MQELLPLLLCFSSLLPSYSLVLKVLRSSIILYTVHYLDDIWLGYKFVMYKAGNTSCLVISLE